MVNWNKVIRKKNEGSFEVDLACFKEKISLVDLHVLVRQISKIKDNVNVKFENVETSGIGNDAKWILYCISLLKDNKNELKKPDSEFSFPVNDTSRYYDFPVIFRELVRRTIIITKLGERNKLDKQKNVEAIVASLGILKKYFILKGDIVEYSSSVALAKLSLPGVGNTEIVAQKNTLRNQIEEITRELIEKINQLSNEIFYSTRPFEADNAQDEKARSMRIDNAFKNFFDAAEYLDSKLGRWVINGKINQFGVDELKGLLKQTNKNKLPQYLNTKIESCLRAKNIEVQYVFSQSPYHKSLFKLLFNKKVTALEQRLFILDLMSCVDDESKKKKLVELAKEHCKSIIEAVNSREDSILSAFFKKVIRYLENTSPKAIGLLRTVEVLSDIKRLSQEKSKAFDTEKISQCQQQERPNEEALIAAIKTWPDNRNWPDDIMYSSRRPTFFKSVLQLGLIKKTRRNKRQKMVDELIRPKSSESYLPKMHTDGFSSLSDFFKSREDFGQDTIQVAQPCDPGEHGHVPVALSYPVGDIGQNVESRYIASNEIPAAMVGITMTGSGELDAPRPSAPLFVDIPSSDSNDYDTVLTAHDSEANWGDQDTVPCYQVSGKLVNDTFWPTNVPPYPVATVTSGGKLPMPSAPLMPPDDNKVGGSKLCI